MSPCDYSQYPKNWKAIRNEILERAKNQCECVGECGFHRKWFSLEFETSRCKEMHMRPPKTFGGKRVILTVAHMNHSKRDSRRRNLRAMCQLCHLRYDAPMKAAKRRKYHERKNVR